MVHSSPQLYYPQVIQILVGVPPLARIRVHWTLSVMFHKDGSVTFSSNAPEMRLSSHPLVQVFLRFTLWCICHFESIWFNLISLPGHTAIICAFSVTIAYCVRPTDSSANKRGLKFYFFGQLFLTL